MSDPPRYLLQLLDPRRHDRRGFACGESSLDTYLQRYARRDVERGAAVVYVLVPKDAPIGVAGYFTLSNATVVLQDVPEDARKGLPRYPDVPATLLGRLAVAGARQGDGLGARLLREALIKAAEASTQVASAAVVVDPLHERAAAFYRRYGFVPLGHGARMFLPMRDVVASLRAAGRLEPPQRP